MFKILSGLVSFSLVLVFAGIAKGHSQSDCPPGQYDQRHFINYAGTNDSECASAAHDNTENEFEGFGGNDWFLTYGGHDILIGGAGDDYLRPGDGPDTIHGGPDRDVIHEGDGCGLSVDHIYAGGGGDDVIAGCGADYVDGGGGSGDQISHCHDGVDDTIIGFDGNHTHVPDGSGPRCD